MARKIKLNVWIDADEKRIYSVNGHEPNSEWARAYQLVLSDALMEMQYQASMLEKKLIMAQHRVKDMDELLSRMAKHK